MHRLRAPLVVRAPRPDDPRLQAVRDSGIRAAMVRMLRSSLVLALATACGDGGSSAEDPSSGATTDAATSSASMSADATTDAASTSEGSERYHPADFAAAAIHGPATKLHAEDCRECHGDDLAGGTSMISCDSCHSPGWRTDCVFCHGGGLDSTGAPPRDIDDTMDMSMLSFIAHPRHVSQYQHAPYDCSQCHRKPTDVLSEGHVFDETDAKAEVDFSAGLSAQATWDGNGGCDSLYCHGNGLVANGSYTHDQPTPTCGGCHPYPGTPNTAYAAMSGQHARHLGENVMCAECHDPLAIETHVDGKPDVAITAAGFAWDPDAKTCTGLCHLENHNEHW